jgi:ribosomal-protein-alanine N-acetyltransferase
MKIIETERIILRQYTLDDVNDLFQILSNPITMSFWPAPFSLEQVEEWIKRNMESYIKNGFGRWGIILKENLKLIGDCGIKISEVDDEERIDLGYIVDHEYWNRGIGTEAAKACAKYGFEILNLNKIYINMAYDNIASMTVAEKLGMKREKEFYNKRNRQILTYLYSMENTNS